MALDRTASRFIQELSRGLVAVACACLLVPGDAPLLAQAAPAASQAKPEDDDAPPAKLSADQLDSLVAPIALYPDDLLAQTLAASTYPLELIQLQQWLAKNKGLKDKSLSDAVAKQPWDPAVQSMAAVPDVVKRLSDDIQWTTDLGNAFLAQQSDVMDACQRMRKKAKDKGALESNQQQKVETKVVEQKTVIVVESANPEVIYVPTYSPTVVYPPPVYPYPPIYYPPYVPGAALVSFGVGMMVGAAFWGGSCCHCGWGGGSVNINVNNNFNRNTNINGGNRGQGGGNNWSHNAQHRGGAPYGDRATANKYGGSARGDSRQASNRQQGAGGAGNRGPSAGTSDRSAGGGNRGASAGTSDRSAGGGSRGGGASDRSGNTAASRGGSDSIGGRDVGSSSKGGGGFGGGSGGMSGSSARASSSRGSSSMSSRGGGGGGGGRGGGGGGRGGGRR